MSRAAFSGFSASLTLAWTYARIAEFLVRTCSVYALNLRTKN